MLREKRINSGLQGFLKSENWRNKFVLSTKNINMRTKSIENKGMQILKKMLTFLFLCVKLFLLNQSLLKIAQKCKTKEGVRNYQKVIKSSFRDATNYFGFLKYNPAVELQIPKVLSFETKKTV